MQNLQMWLKSCKMGIVWTSEFICINSTVNTCNIKLWRVLHLDWWTKIKYVCFALWITILRPFSWPQRRSRQNQAYDGQAQWGGGWMWHESAQQVLVQGGENLFWSIIIASTENMWLLKFFEVWNKNFLEWNYINVRFIFKIWIFFFNLFVWVNKNCENFTCSFKKGRSAFVSIPQQSLKR